jgi:hypothetical protein
MTAIDKPRTIRKGDEDFPSTPVPFKTTNAILAFCLYQLGVPEWRPPVNVYDAPILESISRRLHLDRMPIIRLARFCWERKELGRVEYWFEKTPEIEHYLKWYSDQEAEIKAEGNDKDIGARIREIMALATRLPEDRPKIPGPLMDEREALMRIFCIALKFRIEFMNRWKETLAELEIPVDGKAQSTGPDSTRYPGKTRVPVTASDDMLRKMNLIS